MLVAALLAPAQALSPRTMKSPPGQLKIVTVNTRQNAVLGIKRFEDMFELSQSLRKRPLAFNGGYNGGVHAPDVVVTQEMRPSNLEIFEHLLRQRYKQKYRIAVLEDAASQIIYNSATVTMVGDPLTWEDVCLGASSAGNRHGRYYMAARFTEVATGAPFTVAGMHMPKRFPDGAADCYMRNIEEFRSQLANETGAVFIAGDFNRRAVAMARECDADESSPANPWYLALTAPTDGGRVYVDTVRQWHRQTGQPLDEEWTHEQKSETLNCDNSSRVRRSRIDFIFSSEAIIAEAHADHPGWAGAVPGTKRPGVHKYSDHRFVAGRFVVAGPSQPPAPSTELARGGRVIVTWEPVEGATGYIVYRSIGGRSFNDLATTDGTITTFNDDFTEHGVHYRYSIAPVGTDGGHGLESKKTWATPDSRGPQVSSVTPGPGATGVDRRTNIKVVFNQGVKPTSVTNDRIRLFRGTTRIPGQISIESRRVIVFDPSFALRSGTRYRVRVKPVQDKLGNVGGGKRWEFVTKAKPKRRRR
jgi:endonuclease/exonuclease/phosphatase family metal-dependent hydrolase